MKEKKEALVVEQWDIPSLATLNAAQVSTLKVASFLESLESLGVVHAWTGMPDLSEPTTYQDVWMYTRDPKGRLKVVGHFVPVDGTEMSGHKQRCVKKDYACHVI